MSEIELPFRKESTERYSEVIVEETCNQCGYDRHTATTQQLAQVTLLTCNCCENTYEP